MRWPLNTIHHTFWDRLKICRFFLNPANRWTYDKYVQKFEQTLAKYVGCKYAVFVSSGSTANTLLAMYLKDHQSKNHKRNTVVFPATTWSTSINPFVREGFKPHFIDINLHDLSIDLKRLDKYLLQNSNKVSAVFVTSLLGFSPDIEALKDLANKYHIKILMDNCESLCSKYNYQNISNYFTSTTSTFLGHHLNSVEGGFVFTNNREEYEYFLLNRNHGLTRSLKNTTFHLWPRKNNICNQEVDENFDFYCLGNNFRNTDINAFIGLLDFKRIEKYTEHRKAIYELFRGKINTKKFHVFGDSQFSDNAPFSIPIISKQELRKQSNLVVCQGLGIETRPIISGFLGYQTAYKKYFDNFLDYPNSILVDKMGFYVGLHSGVTEEMVIELVEELNK